MNLLLLVPRWPAPSELWMERMSDTLGAFTKVMATSDSPPPQKTIQGNIPVRYLPSCAPLWYRSAQKVYFALQGKRGRSAAKTRSAAKGLRKLINMYEIDTVLVHYIPTAVQFSELWEELDLKVYAHCHGFDVTWDLKNSHPPHTPVHGDDYPKKVLGLAENVTFIANSRYSARRLDEIGISSNRIIVKYIGVPVEPNFPEREGAEERRNFTILYLGRLIDCKGPDKVIQAFEIASNRGLEGELVIAGDGPLKETCESLRNASLFRDRIKILGVVDAETGKKLRKNADVFAAHNCKGPITNQEEALGVSLLEAMADGLPVVACRSGGVLETVVDGETGLLVHPGEVERQANAFLQLFHDGALRRKMGYQGWLRVKENFSQEKEMMEFKRIFQFQAIPEP